ncbi:MAG TPA: tetratricopeptide repeat protein [Actinomycetes bacterium]|nr:tetratricopeptide repeat protein [Actinomycetes bacterium]
MSVRADAHGNATTVAGVEALEAYDRAVDDLLHFRAAVATSLDAALEADPGFAMGQVAQSYLGVLGTEPDDAAAARASLRTYLSSTTTSSLLPRERAHVAAAQALLAGDLTGGGTVLRELTREHPRDALALAVGHQIDFFTGDAVALRDRVGAALTAWSDDDPHRSLLLGMYAFGLEESGLYSRSQDVALEAVERDERDVWGVHAVAHTLEMQGRFVEGLGYLDGHAAGWQTGNFLSVHNWWHYCLYLLESGDVLRPLEIYDAVLHNAQSANVAMEMLDAAALLWRMLLEGEDQTARWSVLADAWDAKMVEPYYAFNDMHAVMSYLGAGRMADAERLVDARAAYVAEATDESVTNLTMTREVGLPVARALVAFAQGRYESTVAELMPIRYSLNRFGGSHAQRDAVQRTLVEAALRSGQHDLARSLLSERLGINPCSPYNWLKQAELFDRLGEAAAAAGARSQASTLRRSSQPS